MELSFEVFFVLDWKDTPGNIKKNNLKGMLNIELFPKDVVGYRHIRRDK